jgi:glycosyltransferase involved in cell wall biosynthesis
MIRLTVTIATYKRHHLLDIILKRYSEQSIEREFYEIIVCDSQSGEETEKVIEKYKELLNVEHCHTKNILAAKRNLGIAKAKSDFVVFTDDDCIPERNFVEKYLKIKEKNEKDTIYCGEVRFPEEWVKNSAYYRFRDSLHPKYPVGKRDVNFNNIVVMNMGFWKENFLFSVGGVNEKFVGYGCEDIELGWRLTLAKFKLVYDGPIIIHHETSFGISGFMIKIHRASRDGMKSLLEHNPDVISYLKGARILEAGVSKNLFEIIFGKLVYLLSKIEILTKILIKYVDAFDKQRYPNNYIVYRYLMLVAAIKGIKDRHSSLTEEAAQSGWY